MYSAEYHVVVATPIGCRVGDLSITIDEDRVFGELHIPYFHKEYHGTIDNNGDITIEGVISLEDGDVAYIGKGKISTYAISIEVLTDTFCFEINGTSKRNRT